ncbi:hypothetical protein [Mycolicibacterium mageritense]|uniref:hypothetical protein n=1 Tax=Mycolicibacterium mageritense TaxID=53462 RepID=UPI0011D8BE42|nr:hypothetical protein [Mycolicibacterium mageritense]TXI63395.1 MAG: hypothetical protein E6Q55_09540 [Mycolicibacterium mageritense]
MSDNPTAQRQPQFTVLERRRWKLDAQTAVEHEIQTLLRGEDPDPRPSVLYQTRTRIDYASLPPKLAQKVSARIEATALHNPSVTPKQALDPLFGRTDPTRESPAWVWWTLGGTWCASPMLSPLMAMLSEPLGVVFFLSPVPLTAAAVVTIRRWQKRSQLTYTRAEAELVRQHISTVSFKVPRWAKWQDHYAIQVVAARILSAIESSPAWQSTRCDLDRIQLDLAEEMFQIHRSCENLAKLRKVIRAAKPTPGVTSTARAALEDKVSEYEALYLEARAAVIRRVAALHTYRQRLTDVETLLNDLSKATELAARNDDFAEAFAAIVRDTAAAERTETLSADLEILRDQLKAELAFISGNVIHDPELAVPLAVRPNPHLTPG